MPTTAKTQDVTNGIKYLVELNPNLAVDDDNYVIARKKGDYIRVGASEQAIILYSEQIRDTESHILNPFAEGLGLTPASDWFYKSLRVPMQLRIGIILFHAIQLALKHQETKKPAKKTATKKGANATADEDEDETSHIPSDILHIISGVVNDVDEKMLEEISPKLKNTLPNLFQIAYYRNTQTTQFRTTLLYDPDHARESLNIRKKTVTVLNTIFKALFDVKTHDNLVDTYKAKHIQDAPSRMSSFLKCLYKVYDQINPILVQLGEEMAIDDMESFDYHLHRLPEYTMNAKFMASPSMKETATQQPANQTVPNMGVPMPNQPPQPQANTNKTPCGVPLPQQNTQGMMPMGGQQALPQAQPNPQMGGGFGLVPTVSSTNMGGMPQQNQGFMPQQQAGPSFAQQQEYVPQQQYSMPQQQQFVTPQSGVTSAPPAWRGFV